MHHAFLLTRTKSLFLCARSQRRKILISTLISILITIIEVMGIKTLVRSDWIRISPGSFPNQVSVQGAKCRRAPKPIRTNPAMINSLLTAPSPGKNPRPSHSCLSIPAKTESSTLPPLIKTADFLFGCTTPCSRAARPKAPEGSTTIFI